MKRFSGASGHRNPRGSGSFRLVKYETINGINEGGEPSSSIIANMAYSSTDRIMSSMPRSA